MRERLFAAGVTGRGKQTRQVGGKAVGGMRDRLIELLGLRFPINVRNEMGGYDTVGERTLSRGCCEKLADHLIDNGVTVQEWISVKDRLPKDREWVLVWHTGYSTPKKAKYKDDFSPHLPVFLIDGDNGNKGEVTHWMPLPQPPKGE